MRARPERASLPFSLSRLWPSQNILDACIGCIAWFFLGELQKLQDGGRCPNSQRPARVLSVRVPASLAGFGFAYDADGGVDGHETNPFIGSGKSHFALSGVTENAQHGYDWITFFFQYTFAAAAATIVSGAVAERCQLVAYLVYSAGITGFIYPVVVHWAWDSSGFLSPGNKDSLMSGVIDFAGSGVVHMTGGFAALVGAKVLGPRLGRFENPAAFEGHSTPLQAIGTFLLWFGWYGFNPGSTLFIHGASNDMARVAVTTTISAAVGGITGLFAKRFLPPRLGGSGFYELGHTCNSLLGGLVGITAPCSVVHPWAAFLIGFIAAFVYHLASCTMRRAKIDDPLDAFAVHGACGMWGCLAVGIFCVKEYSYAPGGGDDRGEPDAGIFMPGSRGLLFGTQVLFVLIVMAWVVTMSICMFVPLKLLGVFRVSQVLTPPGHRHFSGANGPPFACVPPHRSKRTWVPTSPSTAAPPTSTPPLPVCLRSSTRLTSTPQSTAASRQRQSVPSMANERAQMIRIRRLP